MALWRGNLKTTDFRQLCVGVSVSVGLPSGSPELGLRSQAAPRLEPGISAALSVT